MRKRPSPPTRVALTTLVFLACGNHKEHSDTAASLSHPQVEIRSLDGLLCEPLKSASISFPAASDTTIASEGVSWPAKFFVTTDGGVVTLESSWVDSSRIWHISTTSPQYSVGGLQVGVTIADLERSGRQLSLTVPEGTLFVTIGSDLGGTLDSATEQSLATKEINRVEDIPGSSRLGKLILARDCRTPSAPN